MSGPASPLCEQASGSCKPGWQTIQKSLVWRGESNQKNILTNYSSIFFTYRHAVVCSSIVFITYRHAVVCSSIFYLTLATSSLATHRLPVSLCFPSLKFLILGPYLFRTHCYLKTLMEIVGHDNNILFKKNTKESCVSVQIAIVSGLFDANIYLACGRN
jgi:hypothetical protein